MNDQNPNSDSLFERIKPHIPALCVGALFGAMIGWKLSPTEINLTMLAPEAAVEDLWLSGDLVEDLLEKGHSVIEMATGEVIDLINRDHSSNI